MENNIPTVHDLILKKVQYPKLMDYNTCIPVCDVKELMIEFAKLHVEAALKKASENAKWDSISNDIGFGGSAGYDFIDTDYAGDPCTGYKISVNKDSILNAYPLDKIK